MSDQRREARTPTVVKADPITVLAERLGVTREYVLARYGQLVKETQG